MSVKTYVLLDSMDTDAPIYQALPDGKRMQLKKITYHRPTLRQTFQDENGVSVTIRYKGISNTIYQNEQIEKEKLLANERFTTQERRDTEFKHGILVTDKTGVQKYLEAHPEFLGFKGLCDDVREPRYRLLDNVADNKIKNTEMRLRLNAANKVMELGLAAAQAMLIRLNGSFFKTPDDLEECQNMLMQFVDDAEEPGLKAVLKEETTVDERTTILIGKLINAGILSFDAVEGKISKKSQDGKWIIIRELSNEYSMDEKKRLLSDFMNTEDGKPLKNDLEKDLKELVPVTGNIEVVKAKNEIEQLKEDYSVTFIQPDNFNIPTENKTTIPVAVKKVYSKRKTKKKRGIKPKYSNEQVQDVDSNLVSS